MSAAANPSASVQQMQPLANVSLSLSAATIRSSSMEISPKSLTITAMRSSDERSTWFTSVVLPAPR